MSWTSRSRVRVSKAIVALVALLATMLSGASPARATSATHPPAKVKSAKARVAAGPEFWFTGARLIFEHAEMKDGELAVASDDLGFGRLLTKTGSTLSYDPAQKYLLITTADHRTISFTVGDAHYTIGDLGAVAPFAPYLHGGAVFLPLSALLAALHVEPVVSLQQTILQPQLSGIDVETTSLATIVTLHGATPMRFKRVSDAGDDHLTLALLGVGSALPSDRPVSGVGLAGITVAKGGTPRNPTVVLSFDGGNGGSYVLVPAKSPNDLVFAFAPEGTTLGGTVVPPAGSAYDATTPLAVHAARSNVPPAPPVPAIAHPFATATPDPDDAASPPPGPSAPAQTLPRRAFPIPQAPDAGATPAPAGTSAAAAAASAGSVTSIDYAADGLGMSVNVGLSGGPAGFEYHRLPDDRWYVDLKNVTLATPPRDENVQSDAVTALRVKQLDDAGTPVTRIALSLATPRIVSLKATPGGFVIVVDSLDDLSPKIAGQGLIGAGVVTADAAGTPSLVPPKLAEIGSGGEPSGWKFGPMGNGGGRLIVIDPGHGGSDDGAAHNGLREKDLTLDMARRLRAILVAHGWQVKMTRDSDVDVFGVDASAHDELQARCDVANLANAHLFISIHVNSFTSSDLNGTTTYYYTGPSYALAQSVHRRLVAAGLGTKDDGIIKNNFYVIHHTTMPSILVETAFVSNASDADLLRTPAWRQKLASGIASGVGDYDGTNADNAAFTGSGANQ